jgi:hypothetical protein
MDAPTPDLTPSAPVSPGFSREPLPGGELPDPLTLLDETLKEFTANLGPYCMAGLGQLAVMLPLLFTLIVLIHLTAFGGLLGGGALLGLIAGALPEDLAALVISFGSILLPVLLFGSIMAMLGVLTVLAMPVTASLHRAVVRHQRGEEGALSFRSAFESLTQDMGRVMLTGLLLTTLSLTGLMMCYVPAFFVMLFTGFALNLVAVHRTGGLEAILTAVRHARTHLAWHTKFSLLYLVVLMVGGQIPVAGPMFAVALHMRAYRAVFGDGDAPVLKLT